MAVDVGTESDSNDAHHRATYGDIFPALVLWHKFCGDRSCIDVSRWSGNHSFETVYWI